MTKCAIIHLSAKTEHAGFLLPFACITHNVAIVHRVPVLSLTRAVLADVQARRHGDFAIMTDFSNSTSDVEHVKRCMR
jgi:hypothetical protein